MKQELTQDEIEVLGKVAAMGCQKTCAKKLGVTENYVKHRCKRACEKLGVETTVQAIHLATKRGII
jgi:DNA-binding CsgD family transcriptional regulator